MYFTREFLKEHRIVKKDVWRRIPSGGNQYRGRIPSGRCKSPSGFIDSLTEATMPIISAQEVIPVQAYVSPPRGLGQDVCPSVRIVSAWPHFKVKYRWECVVCRFASGSVWMGQQCVVLLRICLGRVDGRVSMFSYPYKLQRTGSVCLGHADGYFVILNTLYSPV
jgi:hypothetical protein